MSPKKGNTITNRLRSFKHAFRGLTSLLKHEPNARIHLIAMLVVIGCGAYFKISLEEWLAVLVVIALVFSFEAINTSIENLCDVAHPEIHPKIKIAKDVAAAAVLISAIISVVVGLLVFGPHFRALLF